MTQASVLAVDGGNSKTDLALVTARGDVLSLARGPLSSPHHIGVEGCLDVLERLLDEALREAGLEPDGPVADVGVFMLAGIDLPGEAPALHERITARRWVEHASVENDTFAILRAGTERGWGVAVVCGAGINCVGVAPDGRHTRFPSLGAITGDWGGGSDVGLAALGSAVRSEDGRGRKTSLEHAVAAHFGLDTAHQLAEAIHTGRISRRRLVELAPVVFAEAGRDPVAAEIIDRVAEEIVSLARVALTRLELLGRPVDVVLGGGLLRASNGRLVDAVESRLGELGPELSVQVNTSPPIVGAALAGLDRLDAGHDARARLRDDLGRAVLRIEQAA